MKLLHCELWFLYLNTSMDFTTYLQFSGTQKIRFLSEVLTWYCQKF